MQTALRLVSVVYVLKDGWKYLVTVSFRVASYMGPSRGLRPGTMRTENGKMACLLSRTGIKRNKRGETLSW